MSDFYVSLPRDQLEELLETSRALSDSSARFCSQLSVILRKGHWVESNYIAPEGWEKKNKEFHHFVRFCGIEEGPPETPEFLLEIANTIGSKSETEKWWWARHPFAAGFWARVAFDTHTPYTEYYTPEQPNFWIALREEDSQSPSVFESLEEANRYTSDLPAERKIVQSFKETEEVFIFCSGAASGSPIFKKWRSLP